MAQCRSCGGAIGPVFCDLGVMPVANAYLAAPDPAEPVFPLCAVVCAGCRMVQLDHVVDAQGIFSDYAYFSSASTSWLAHARAFCTAMEARFAPGFVIEVASNDGYLLQNFVAMGRRCLGIEPAANVAAAARAAGVPTETLFLDQVTAAEIVARHGRADLVVANNVLAHVPDINGFVGGLAMLLADDGVLSVEAPHLLRMVEDVQFDTIYHEHYAYWSLFAVEQLFARHGLAVFDVAVLPTHGGSLRILAARNPRAASDDLRAIRAMEHAAGLQDDAFYLGFQARVAGVLAGFHDWLATMQASKARIACYGAAAKGNTFLNAAGVKAGAICAVADLAASKQGKYLPGSHIPVLAPAQLLALEPDHILILPWNIAPEVVAQLRAGGFDGGLWTAVPEMRAL